VTSENRKIAGLWAFIAVMLAMALLINAGVLALVMRRLLQLVNNSMAYMAR
jgi:hypothetical protein